MKKIKTFILVLIFLMLVGCSNKLKEYTKTLHYFNEDINIKIYVSSEKRANLVFKEIEDIYKTHENITDRLNINSEVSYIYNNHLIDDKIKISNEMNDLIEYGFKLYQDSNHVLSINTGDLVDLWELEYKNNKIPSNDDLKNIDTSMDKIKLKNNVLDNNHVNLNFEQFIISYTNNLVKKYLKSVNINYYFINTNNDILIGSGINNEDYVVILSNPFNNETLKVYSMQNKYLKTISIYHNNYKYDDKIYSNIVNAKDKTMAGSMISVSVLSDDVYTSEYLANMLFILDYDSGYKLAKNYNVSVIWCYIENNEEKIQEM